MLRNTAVSVLYVKNVCVEKAEIERNSYRCLLLENHSGVLQSTLLGYCNDLDQERSRF